MPIEPDPPSNIRLVIAILFVFTIAGGLLAGLVSNRFDAFYYGLFLGLFVGLGVLMTVDYAILRREAMRQ